MTGHFTAAKVQLKWVHDVNKFRNSFSTSRTGRKLHSNISKWINEKAEIENRIYYFLDRYGVVALRLHYGVGFNLNRDSQFSLGGNYVRGFSFRSQLGQFAYLGSLEYRTPPYRLWYFALGAVAFFDLGEVRQDIPERASVLVPEPSIGIGFRSTIIEFDNSLFRIDFGFPLRQGRFSTEGLFSQLNFGLSHAF